MEPLTSHETPSDLNPSPTPAPNRERTPIISAPAIGALLIALMFIAAILWTERQWTQRLVHSADHNRETLWSIETPASEKNQAFIRIQDTGYWTTRAYGLLTSNSHLATQGAAVELKNPSTGARVVVAAHSVVHFRRTNIEILSGFARVSGPLKVILSTGDRVVSAKESLVIAAESRAVGTASTVTTSQVTAGLEPLLGSTHDLQTSGVVNFAWPKALASTSAVLEFARDSAFKTVLFTQPASGAPNTRVDFSDRAPGAWFVRLREGEKNVAHTSFSVVESETPDMLRRLGRRWMAWRDRGVAAIYRVEFSTTEAFQEVSHSFQVRNRELDLSQVSAGNYFVRVVAITVANTEHTSRPIAIKVPEKSEMLRAGLELNDPELKLFARGWKILLTHDETSRIREGYVILRESELRGVKVSAELTHSFQTEGRTFAHDLVFELSRDESFANPERVRPDIQGELLPPALPLGLLYARLRRVENDGTLGAYGPASRLTTWLPAPLTPKPKSVSVDGKRGFDLKWELATTVPAYELKVSSTREFTPETTEVIRTRTLSRKIQAASAQKTFWTVTAINDIGQPISMTSEIQEIIDVKPKSDGRIKPLAKLDNTKRAPAMIAPLTPELQSPDENAVLVGGATATKYGKLIWTSSNADGFELQIATDGDFVNIIEKAKTKKMEFTLQGDLPEGALFWRVRKAHAKEWSQSRRFELVYE